MAAMTKNQRFPLARGHDLNPLRLLSACVFFQVFESANMVDLDVVSGTAMLTFPRQEAFFEFRSGVAVRSRKHPEGDGRNPACLDDVDRGFHAGE